MTITRRQVVGGAALGLLFHSSTKACSFGEKLIEGPIETAPGTLGFGSVRAFLLSLYPEWSAVEMIQDDVLLIQINRLAENTAQRLLSVRYLDVFSEDLISFRFIVILQRSLNIRTETGQVYQKQSFEKIAEFRLGNGAMPIISTRIKSDHEGAMLIVVLVLQTKDKLQLRINQSVMLRGAPCFSYRYFES